MQMSDIKLNETQAEKAKELDEKIRELGRPVEPSQTEHDERLGVVEAEINKLNGHLQTLNGELAERNKERESYYKENAPGFAEQEANDKNVNSIKNRIASCIEEQKTVKANIIKLVQDYKRKQHELGIKSRDDAESRIEELNHQMETETLSNQELKKKLAEVDRIQSNFKKLEVLEEMREELDSARARDAELIAEIGALRLDRNTALERSKSVKEAGHSVSRRLDEMKQAEKAVYERIREQKKLIGDKIQQRKEIEHEFWEARRAYRAKVQQSTELLHEKRKIYAEAERIMLQMEEGRRKVGEIKERKNPNEVQITAANALISYLEKCLSEMGAKPEEKLDGGKKGSKDVIDFLKGLHKPSKKQKEKKSAKPQPLSHSLQTMSQFMAVDIVPPTTADQIPACLASLREKVQAWSDSFSRAIVDFTVGADGKVSVAISLK
jgi:chromosome segregation ATPase